MSFSSFSLLCPKTYFFKVDILEAAEDLAVCVGFLPKGKEKYKEHLGWSGGSLAYHGDDGKVK